MGVFLCSRSCRHLDAQFEHGTRLEWRVFVFKGLPPPGSPLRTRKHTPEWCVFVLEALPPHFEHESMPKSVCFCARGLAATSTPTKQRLEWRVFVFKGLPPPGHNFEHESTTSNGAFWCSKPCLHHDAHFEHESTPQRVYFCIRCPSSSLPFPT